MKFLWILSFQIEFYRIPTEFFAVETLRTTTGSLQSVEQFTLCPVPILVLVCSNKESQIFLSVLTYYWSSESRYGELSTL